MCELNFTVGKISISLVAFFFLWCITHTCQSQICFRELMKAKFERKWSEMERLDVTRSIFVPGRNLTGGAINENKGISWYQFRLFVGSIPPDQLVISLSGIRRPQFFFFCKPLRWVHCLSHSTNLPRVECTGIITHIICANNSRIVIARRDQR